jgi:molybdopterin-containing oxidoreductase family iron-sulfur binding subunit
MKRKTEHPQPSAREKTGPRYWRSLDELAGTPGFREAVAREFPEGASSMDGVDRRQFMKIMAASFALGGVGLAGCRRPEEHILPFAKSVEGAVPGLPVYYATAMPMRGWAIPLLAETHQGRPTKLEGNPSYGPHGGASSLLAQASILDLYDPDRATAHTQGGEPIDSDALKALLGGIGKAYAPSNGEGLAFLAETSASPTRNRVLRTLGFRIPKALWAEYEPVEDEPPLAVGRAFYGSNVRPVYRFAKAKRILSIDADFLQAEAGSLAYARDFAKGRRVAKKDDPMSRLYMAESGLTITGTMADHRLRLPTSHMTAFACAVALKLTGDPRYAGPAAGIDVKPEWISECAADLFANRGECLVVAGSHLPEAAHAVVTAINEFLGNVGSTVEFILSTRPQTVGIAGLAAAIRRGAVKTLVILGGNPVYNAPADLDWAALQKSVPQVVRFGYYEDETSELAGTHIAAAHYLESWGDAQTADGTVVPVQPMILPLFGGLTQIEVLAMIGGFASTDPYQLVFDTITGGAGPASDARFRKFLHDGVLEGSASKPVHARYNAAPLDSYLAALHAPPEVSSKRIEVRFVADARVDDGRFINNGWLQECPDPITKISWDNAIQISPRLARELGIDSPADGLKQVARKDLAEFDKGRENAHLLELTVNGRKITGPAHIQPGLANYTVIVPLGYGRTRTGRVGEGTGFNAYPAREAAALHFATGASVALTGRKMFLADSQWHWSMEGRDLVREGNLGEYEENPAFAKEIGLEAESPRAVLDPNLAAMSPADRASQIPRGNSLYSTPKFDGSHQWGMSIDLNTCIGCNACVVACQAENNIPIVGKDQVLRGRIMHWIRLDRYYSDGKAASAAFGGAGNDEIPEEPQISVQPVACMQCELAPCETVCPVNATVHDDEGLNVMAYNRCIGTRYCANNCPYKVRRFNFFDWNMRRLDSLYMGPLGPEGMPELVQMVKNPEVTVRMRGVMEKCTYCVQRIERGKIEWKVKSAQEGHPEDVVVPDGTIRTACQQACPVESIVFGNILDPQSAVSRAKALGQDYALLGYLNTRPRTTYLARIRNPNPRMPDYAELPLSRVENWNKNHPTKA